MRASTAPATGPAACNADVWQTGPLRTADRRPPSAAAAHASPLALLGLLLVALSLRPQLSAMGPLAPAVIDELGVTHAQLGLLTTIPVLCMGLFAPVGPALVRWLGVRAAIAASVSGLVLFALGRAMAPSFPVMLLATFGVGVCTAIVGPMLPMFVRERMGDRMVLATAAYAAGINGGAGLATGVSIPLDLLTGSWRGALVALAAAAGAGVVAWVLLSRQHAGEPLHTAEPRVRPRLSVPRLPYRRGIAWAIGILFGLQSVLYYGTTAWMASVYVEQGWAKDQAGLLLTVVLMSSLSGVVLVPWLSRRGASRRSLLASASCSGLLGLLGIALVPGPAILWALLLGLALGAVFTLVMTLPTDIAADARDAGAAAALVFLIGYLIASAAPFVMGAVRDATGSFSASVWFLVLVAAAIVPLGWSMSPRRLRPPEPVAAP